MHHQFHRYVPRVDFVSGVDNLISDRPSRSSDLTDNQLLAYLETNPPQSLPWQLWTPPLKQDIQEGLYVGRATAADGHWTKWAYFCARVPLDPLRVAYKDPFPIFNAFAQYYLTGNIAHNIRTAS